MKMNTRMIRLTTGRMIVRYRKSRGLDDAAALSQAVYSVCGVRLEPEALRDMELGRREFPVDVVAVLASYFGVTIDDLVGFTPLPTAV